MRPALVVLLVGLALAVGIPTTWVLTRPATSAGPPVEQVLADTPVTAAPPTSPSSGLPPVTARPATPTVPAPVAPPVRLTVGSVGLDAPVDAVGTEPDGTMTIPADVDRVGWYRFGPAPGDPAGSVVVAGHVDDAEQGLGALAPLRETEVGAEVVLTDAAGATTTWRVVSREAFDKETVPLAGLFERAGPPRLVLITCGGPFLADIDSYRDNVVVIAEPVR